MVEVVVIKPVMMVGSDDVGGDEGSGEVVMMVMALLTGSDDGRKVGQQYT